jgi:EpsI family protein
VVQDQLAGEIIALLQSFLAKEPVPSEQEGYALISWNTRFATVAVLLAGTGLFLQTRARNPFVPSRISLASFPVQLKNWSSTDLPIPNEILKTLGPGEFLQRRYVAERTQQPTVDLYLAYLPNEHSLFSHLPQDCLTGSGWTTLESGTTILQFPGETAFEANRYLIGRGTDRQLVLFWYWAHGRRVASEDWMNLYLAFDSLRLNRSDNALIRLNTPLRPDENPQEAEQRLISFVELLNPLLNGYIPR